MAEKSYYVNCWGYSTHCRNYKDALELYKHRKMYEDEVTLTNGYNGKIIFSWKRK